MSMTDQEEHKNQYNRLQELVKAAYDALQAAQDYAEEHSLSFHFGPSYGMGGYFEGDKTLREYTEDGWTSSSHNC